MKRLFYLTIATFALFFSCSINVIYDANGATAGTVPANMEVKKGESFVASENTGNLIYEKVGEEQFKFGGWNTKADGTGSDVSNTIAYTTDTDVVLFAKWVKYELKDKSPSGGSIFYDKGTFSDGWRYLEVAPSEYGFDKTTWSETKGTRIVNTMNQFIGKGKEATDEIMMAIGFESTAAKLCYNLSFIVDGKTYDSWYLPNYEELTEARKVLTPNYLEGETFFIESERYWSSYDTPVTPSNEAAIVLDGDPDSVSWGDKTTGYYYVKAIRRF